MYVPYYGDKAAGTYTDTIIYEASMTGGSDVGDEEGDFDSLFSENSYFEIEFEDGYYVRGDNTGYNEKYCYWEFNKLSNYGGKGGLSWVEGIDSKIDKVLVMRLYGDGDDWTYMTIKDGKLSYTHRWKSDLKYFKVNGKDINLEESDVDINGSISIDEFYYRINSINFTSCYNDGSYSYGGNSYLNFLLKDDCSGEFGIDKDVCQFKMYFCVKDIYVDEDDGEELEYYREVESSDSNNARLELEKSENGQDDVIAIYEGYRKRW